MKTLESEITRRWIVFLIVFSDAGHSETECSQEKNISEEVDDSPETLRYQLVPVKGMESRTIVASGLFDIRTTLETLYPSVGQHVQNKDITFDQKRQGHDVQDVFPFIELMFRVELIQGTEISNQ